jgi:hypothetical protein
MFVAIIRPIPTIQREGNYTAAIMVGDLGAYTSVI